VNDRGKVLEEPFRDEASGEDSERESLSELSDDLEQMSDATGRGVTLSSENPDDSCSRRSCHVWRSADFWATVCKTVRPTLSDRCLSVCLSVTLVYCDQTVGLRAE